jgi:hypothetical protein
MSLGSFPDIPDLMKSLTGLASVLPQAFLDFTALATLFPDCTLVVLGAFWSFHESLHVSRVAHG